MKDNVQSIENRVFFKQPGSPKNEFPVSAIKIDGHLIITEISRISIDDETQTIVIWFKDLNVFGPTLKVKNTAENRTILGLE